MSESFVSRKAREAQLYPKSSGESANNENQIITPFLWETNADKTLVTVKCKSGYILDASAVDLSNISGDVNIAGDLSIKGVQSRTLVNVEKIVENVNASTTGDTLVNLGTPCVYVPLFADSIVIAHVTYSVLLTQTGGDNDAMGTIFARCVDSNETTQLKWLGSDDTASNNMGIVNAGENASIRDIFSITDECVRGDDGKIRVRAYGARLSDSTPGYACVLTLLWQSVLFTEYR